MCHGERVPEHEFQESSWRIEGALELMSQHAMARKFQSLSHIRFEKLFKFDYILLGCAHQGVRRSRVTTYAVPAGASRYRIDSLFLF
jgi:hypothetical protein